MFNAKISRWNKKTKAFIYYESENQPIVPKLKTSNCQEQHISRDLRIARLVPLHYETTLDQQRALNKLLGAGKRGRLVLQLPGAASTSSTKPRAELHGTRFPSGHPLGSLRPVANFHYVCRRGEELWQEGGWRREKRASDRNTGSPWNPANVTRAPAPSLLRYPQTKLFFQPAQARFLQITVDRISHFTLFIRTSTIYI